MFEQLARTRKGSEDPDIDLIAGLYNKINRTSDPPSEKLLKKDEELAYRIYEMWLSGKSFVNDLLLVLMQIEDILWELKGGEGEYPKPKERPKKPSPRR
ncbi:MAG TPA: hypothetical protein VGV35_11195 [Bryobacteraceae bacterium]|nr:hypothetical protein [Bryobacteraceae bacterium]